MIKFIIKHLEWESEVLFCYDFYRASTPIGVLVVQRFTDSTAVVYWEDEQPLHRTCANVHSAKDLAEFMFTERLHECFKTSKGYQELATIEYEEAVEIVKQRRGFMVIGMESGNRLHNLGFDFPPAGVADSHGDVFSEDAQISWPERFDSDDITKKIEALGGVPRYGKSMQLKTIIDSIGEIKEESLTKPSFDEPKSKYINKPQRNYRKR